MSVRLVTQKELESNPRGRDSRIDSVHRIPKKDNFFSQLELTQIKNTLYKTKQEEFKGAQIFSQTNEWSAGAREVGYDMYEPTGLAQVGSKGANANDVPFVGEATEEKSQKAVEIEIGIRYTRNELEAIETRNQYGRGANINLVTERATGARRFISSQFDRGIFQGFEKFGMTGLQSIIPAARQSSLPTDNLTPFYEGVLASGSGSGDARRLWANKTGLQIYDDLLRAKLEAVQRAGIFNADTLVVDSAAFRYLSRPFSDLNNMSLIKYITESTPYADPLFSKVFTTNAVSVVNNGRSNTYFVVCDSSQEIAEIPILRPMTVYPAVEDFNQDIKQLVAMRYAGLMVKYTGAFYFGDSHIETLA